MLFIILVLVDATLDCVPVGLLALVLLLLTYCCC